MTTLEATPHRSGDTDDKRYTPETDFIDPEVTVSTGQVKGILKNLESDPQNAEVYVRMYDAIEQSPQEAVREGLLEALAQRAFGMSLAQRAEMYADARRQRYAETFGTRALEDEETTTYDASGSVIKQGFKRVQPEDLDKARKELLATVDGDMRYTEDEKDLVEFFRVSAELKERARELVEPSLIGRFLEAEKRRNP